MVGVVTAGEPLLLVLEYCEYGSLKYYLEKRRDVSLNLTSFAVQCARGLDYLASLK